MSRKKFQTLYELEEYGEFNLDFEEDSRIIHMQVRLTPREYYLINHFGMSRKPKMSFNDTIMGLIKASGVFDNPVDFFGNVEYKQLPKIDKDIKFKKKAKPVKADTGSLFKK